MLADPVQIVEVAADVIPEPVAAAIQDNTVLLAVVVIRLVLAPRRASHHLTYTHTTPFNQYEKFTEPFRLRQME